MITITEKKMNDVKSQMHKMKEAKKKNGSASIHPDVLFKNGR